MRVQADRNGVHLARLTVSPGCLFVLALGWYLDAGWVVPLCAAAAALHEGGHLLACVWLRLPVLRLRITCCGGVLETGRTLTGGEEVAVALAGPGVNLFLAAVCRPWGQEPMGAVFLGANVLLGVFNLLPLLPLDGGRAIHGLLSLRCPGAVVERWMQGMTYGVLALLTLMGVLLGILGNPSLLLVAALLWRKEDRGAV